MHQPSTPQPPPASELVEPISERRRRHSHRTGLYAVALGLIGLLVVLIALAVANTRQVQLNWLVGTGHASLVWIIVATAILGWLVGIVTSVVFRRQTRLRHKPAPDPTSSEA